MKNIGDRTNKLKEKVPDVRNKRNSEFVRAPFSKAHDAQRSEFKPRRDAKFALNAKFDQVANFKRHRFSKFISENKNSGVAVLANLHKQLEEVDSQKLFQKNKVAHRRVSSLRTGPKVIPKKEPEAKEKVSRNRLGFSTSCRTRRGGDADIDYTNFFKNVKVEKVRHPIFDVSDSESDMPEYIKKIFEDPEQIATKTKRSSIMVSHNYNISVHADSTPEKADSSIKFEFGSIKSKDSSNHLNISKAKKLKSGPPGLLLSDKKVPQMLDLTETAKKSRFEKFKENIRRIPRRCRSKTSLGGNFLLNSRSEHDVSNSGTFETNKLELLVPGQVGKKLQSTSKFASYKQSRLKSEGYLSQSDLSSSRSSNKNDSKIKKIVSYQMREEFKKLDQKKDRLTNRVSKARVEFINNSKINKLSRDWKVSPSPKDTYGPSSFARRETIFELEAEKAKWK